MDATLTGGCLLQYVAHAPVLPTHVPWMTLDSALPLGQISGSVFLQGTRSKRTETQLLKCMSGEVPCDRPRLTNRSRLAIGLAARLTRSTLPRQTRCTLVLR